MPITLGLTPEQIARYRASAHKRCQREKADIEHRRELAWQSAKHAARVLRRQFHAIRVVAFGFIERFWKHLKDIACANRLFQDMGEVVDSVVNVLVTQNDFSSSERFLFQIT
jgi:hypothetical protein